MVKSVPWGKDITVTGKLVVNDGSGIIIANATIRFDGDRCCQPYICSLELKGKDTATPIFEVDLSVLNASAENTEQGIKTFTFVLTVSDREGKKDQDSVNV